MIRFKRVYLLHGKGGSPNGTVRLLKHAMVPHINGIIFIRPDLAHHDPAVAAEESVERLAHWDIPADCLLIGISLGGLVAAKVQELYRPDLHVITVSSPTWADELSLKGKAENRVALYSSNDEVIAGRTADWPSLASEAYDLSWLTHDTDRHLEPLAVALSTYVNDEALDVLLSPKHKGHSL